MKKLTAAAPFLVLAALLALGAALPVLTAPAKVRWEPLPSSSTPGPLAVQVTLAQPRVRSGAELYAQIEVRGRAVERRGDEARAPVNMVLLLDRSGSMSGELLEDARQAALALLERLGEQDQVALIHYADDVRTVRLANLTPQHRAELVGALSALEASGSTNISGALDAAAALFEARGVRGRTVLLTDGRPTYGDVSEQGLVSRAGALRSAGSTLTALGVGEGYNELLLQALAERGAGFYGYLAHSAQLAGILDRELDHAARELAQQVEVQIVPGLPLAGLEVLGWKSRVEGGRRVVSLPNLAEGQTERIMVRVRAPLGAPGHQAEVLHASVSYTTVGERPERKRATAASAPLTLAASEEEERSHRDEAVFANGLRAEGSRKLAQVREELAAGRVESARGLFGELTQLFSGSADLLSGELQLFGASAQALSGNPDARVIAAEQKKAHHLGLSSFGTSTY